MSRSTQDSPGPLQMSPTGLSPSLVGLPRPFGYLLGSLMRVLQPRPHLHGAGLGFSRFARHYYGNLG